MFDLLTALLTSYIDIIQISHIENQGFKTEVFGGIFNLTVDE